MNRQLTKSIETILAQIGTMLNALSDEQYGRSLPVLSGASLGGHVRHVIEFFIELDRGYRTGDVNYDARRRDKAIEQQREVALTQLHRIAATLGKENKVLSLTTAIEASDTGFRVTTNYERELVYNLEHAVHHMALMKIGIRALTALPLPESFGVASSTIRYRQAQCAQ
jgi:uncharacterized damage-inducible protein DinB